MSCSDDYSGANYNTMASNNDNPSNNPITDHNEHENIRDFQALIKLMSLECERERVCNPDVWPRATIMTPHLMAVLSEYENIWDDLSDTFLYYKSYVQELYKEWLGHQTPQVRETLQFLQWPSRGFIDLSVSQRIDSFHKAQQRLVYLVRSCNEGTIRRPAVMDIEIQDADSRFEYIRRAHEDWKADLKIRGPWREEFITHAETERKRVFLSDPPTAVMKILSRYDDLWSDYEKNVPTYSRHNQLQHKGWRNRK